MSTLNIDTAKNPDVEEIRDTLITVTDFSSHALVEISGIANLALTALETPKGHQDVNDIAAALIAIWGKAAETNRVIRSETKMIGYVSEDEGRRRRWAARQAFEEEMKRRLKEG